MRLDLEHFPLVLVDYDAPDNTAPEEQVRQLLSRGEHFVMISGRPPVGHQDDTPENRKSRAAFFKSHKAQLKALCAGAVMIEGDKPVARPFKIMASTLGRVFGVRFAFVRDRDAAMEVARAMLG